MTGDSMWNHARFFIEVKNNFNKMELFFENKLEEWKIKIK